MSRFLDAMRDRGKSGLDGEESRTYRGTVVDASEVLGSDEQLTLVAEDLAGEKPAYSASVNGSDQTRGPYPESERPAVSDQPGHSGTHATHKHEPDVTSTVYADSVHQPASDDGRGYPSAGPAVHRESRRFRAGLDPLFYLIIGIAAAGLFLCLYALITQNDAYFEREYQQLQKESAALQARLAASAELQADLFAANQRALENNVPLDPGIAVEPTVNIERPAEAAVLANASQPATPASAEEITPEVVADEVPIDVFPDPPLAESAPPGVEENSVVETVNPAFLELQQEVVALRETLNRQEEIINRLERDNRELNIDRQTEPARPSNSEPAVDSVLPSQSSPADATATSSHIEQSGTQATAQATSSANAESDSVVTTSVVPQNPTSLASPVQNADEKVGDLIRQGYLAYQSKNYNASADSYGKALEFDPYNRDANLGVAAIAQLNGDNKLAADRYRHLLTLDPADETAFSALLNLSGGGGEGAIIEFELLQHAENTRDAPSLYVILANYYSRQQRWSKASDLYAVALKGGVANADYLFNYAVSLDNEGRSEQAVEYYSQALMLMDGEPFSFDAEAVRQRLKSLRATQ